MRKTRSLNIDGIEYTIQQVFPIDMADRMWPLSYYHIIGEASPEINWGLKPDYLIKHESNIDTLIQRSVVGGVDIPGLSEESKRSLLLAIFLLSYGGNVYGCMVSREWIEWVYFHCKTFGGIEPWVYVQGGSMEPAGLNPMRWDFNSLVMRIGLEKEAELRENARSEAE